jgi:conflict system STAND superfamily ATPase
MRAPLTPAPSPLALPKEPFRGIEPFRYIDAPIFFARDEESAKLVRLVTIYRGTLLYGDSGSGKSSLINARFLPDIIAEGFRPDRLRVQPRAGEEFIVERISLAGGRQPPFLPSSFAPDAAREPRVVLSSEAFHEAVAKASREPGAHALLVFDQFEELATQFEEAPSGRDALAAAAEVQRRIVGTLLHLLRDQALRVKLLFVFREDYLAKVHRLFASYPDLSDRYLRLTPPRVESLPRIIRGPFDEHPGHFGREISPELAGRLEGAIAERCESGVLNLSEVQIACLRLWQSPDPEKLFAGRGVAGLLEDYSLDALNRLSEAHRGAAIAVLASLVTAAGTRNIVSGDDLISRVRQEEQCDAGIVEQALAALVTDARLVRRELRHDTPFYEIVSEFLIPWILRQKTERRLEQQRAEAARKLAAERDESALKLKEASDAAERRRAQAEIEAVRHSRRRLRRSVVILSTLVGLLIAALVVAGYQTIQVKNLVAHYKHAYDLASKSVAASLVERGYNEQVRDDVVQEQAAFAQTNAAALAAPPSVAVSGWCYLGNFKNSRWVIQVIDIPDTQYPKRGDTYRVSTSVNLRDQKPGSNYALGNIIGLLNAGDIIAIDEIPSVDTWNGKAWAKVRRTATAPAGQSPTKPADAVPALR